MIASPGDVQEERQAVRDLIYEWNALNADERKQVLLPIGWETHSAPDMKAPAQSIINESVLAPCDLLVGIFWTRIGTATAEYASGTVEEIQRHIASGKPAMLYFSEALVKPEINISKQFKQLQKFKSYCQPKGLYEGFSSLDEFKRKFRNQLQINIKKYFPVAAVPASNHLLSLVKSSEKLELSIDEQSLLQEAAQDSRGIIQRHRIAAGTYIQTNRINFIKEQSPREIAKWDAIIGSLVHKGLFKPVGYKGEVFEVTAAGFEVIDNSK
ncbi:DUF4062 domain-containing protein [Hymenobacter armeniacus]|nr:DUF4062 domain-containing protein [Hymenobacter armeniacus]